MRVIPLATAPQQSLSVRLDDSRLVLTLKKVKGCMVADLERDGEYVIRGTRVLAGEPIIPYAYLEEGNFLLQTINDELPDWTQFGVSQTLLYLTVAEVTDLKRYIDIDDATRLAEGSGYAAPTPSVLGADEFVYGVAVQGSTIEVVLAGVVYTPTVSAVDGSWKFPVPLLENGTYPIVARYVTPVAGPWSEPFLLVMPTPYLIALRAQLFGEPAGMVLDYLRNAALVQLPGNTYLGPASGLGAFTRATTKTRLNAAGILQSVPVNEEAFDFSLAGAALGLSMEGARTNVILNNTMVGGVAGTPGTLPTGGWSTSDGGLTRALSFGVEDGINYIDVKYAGIASGTEAFILLSTAYSAAIASGSAYTGSVFAGFTDLITPPNSADHRLYWVAGDANVSGTAIPVSVIPAGALKTKRILQTRTPTLAATGVQTRVRFALTIGNSYDFTIRIGLPQLEAGTFASSPILTGGTTATRAQDFLTFGPTGGLPFAGYDQTRGAIIWEGVVENISALTMALFSISNDSITDTIHATVLATGNVRFQVIVDGVTQAQISTLAPIVPNTLFRVLCLWDTNRFEIWLNGERGSVDTAGSIPALSVLKIGRSATNGAALYGHVARPVYFPTPPWDKAALISAPLA